MAATASGKLLLRPTGAGLRQFELIGGLLEAMEELGWGAVQAESTRNARPVRDALEPSPYALVTARRHALSGWMGAGEWPSPLGWQVSSRPSPPPAHRAAGAHLNHTSLWDTEGRNPLSRPPR